MPDPTTVPIRARSTKNATVFTVAAPDEVVLEQLKGMVSADHRDRPTVIDLSATELHGAIDYLYDGGEQNIPLIVLSRHANVIEIATAGEIDFWASQAFRVAMKMALRTELPIVANLTRTSFMDASGLHVLSMLVQTQRASCLVFDPAKNRAVWILFSASRFLEVMAYYPDMKSAIHAINTGHLPVPVVRRSTVSCPAGLLIMISQRMATRPSSAKAA